MNNITIYIVKYEDEVITAETSRDNANKAIDKHNEENATNRWMYEVMAFNIAKFCNNPNPGYAEFKNAIKQLIDIAKLVTIKQVISNNEICDSIGLNPWVVNEGRATGNERVDISKITDVIKQTMDF